MELTPYVPRLVLQWSEDCPEDRYRRLQGTLAFCDLSGFTAMSEKLAVLGRLGAEELADVLNLLFSALLADAAAYGGSLLKYGGDAVLLFFEGDDHAARGAAATHQMRATLRRIGRVKTSRGTVRVRMSVGVHTGAFDFFLVGDSHRELIVTGPGATTTCDMETAADAGQILISPETAAALAPACVGEAKSDGFLLARKPRTPAKDPLAWGAVPDSDPVPFIPVGLRQHVGGVGVDAEHRHIAVGFVAFGGVDELLAAEGGENTAEVLHTFITACQAAFDRYGICFLYADVYGNGGKVFFIAGAPVSHEDNEERILRAALEISSAHHHGLHLHTGLNRGYVFAGDIGARFRRTYTVLGDAVNTAARVMASCDEDNQVRSMPEVLELASSRFATVAQAPFAAKGKTLPLATFAVGEPLGPRSSDAPLPLVGRDDELAALVECLDNAKAGSGGLLHVAGVAGVGKSRLVEELLAKADADGFATVTTFAERYEQGTPYFVLRQLLAIIFGGAELAADSLVAAARELAPDHTEWIPLLGPVVGFDLPRSEATPEVPDEAFPAALGRYVVRLLEGILDGPSLWIAENGHLVDEVSAKVIATVVNEITRHPWMMLSVERTEEPTGLSTLHGHTVAVEPLSVEAATRLVRAANPSVLPTDASRIANRSDGNPMFLRQLVAAAGDGDIADTVETAISARIDRLPAQDRDVLRTAAVLGGRFELGDLRELLDGRPIDLAPLRDFLGTTETGELVFRQALYREVAYSGLTFKRRRALHLAAGRLLETDTIDDRLQLNRLSTHFDAAQAWEKSWEYSTRAAELSRLTAAKAVAAIFYERALRAATHLTHVPDAERARTASIWGQMLFHAGRVDEAKAAFRRARRLTPVDSLRRAEVELGDATIALSSGELKLARRTLRRGVAIFDALAPSVDDPLYAETGVSLLAALADCEVRFGRMQEAWKIAERAAAVADTSGQPPEIARVHALKTLIALNEGDAARALEEGGLALATQRAYGKELGGMAIMAMNLCGINQVVGNWVLAEELGREAYDVFAQIGNDTMAATTQVSLAEVFIDQGRWSEAFALLDESQPVLERMNDAAGPYAGALRARATLRSGQASTTEFPDQMVMHGFAEIVCGAKVEAAIIAADPVAAHAELTDADAKGVDIALRPAIDAAIARLEGADPLMTAREAERVATEAGDDFAAIVARVMAGADLASDPVAHDLGLADVPVWAKRRVPS